jgi:hypothetical protein
VADESELFSVLMHTEEKLKGMEARELFPELTIYICTGTISFPVSFLSF